MSISTSWQAELRREAPVQRRERRLHLGHLPRRLLAGAALRGDVAQVGDERDARRVRAQHGGRRAWRGSGERGGERGGRGVVEREVAKMEAEAGAAEGGGRTVAEERVGVVLVAVLGVVVEEERPQEAHAAGEEGIVPVEQGDGGGGGVAEARRAARTRGPRAKPAGVRRARAGARAMGRGVAAHLRAPNELARRLASAASALSTTVLQHCFLSTPSGSMRSSLVWSEAKEHSPPGRPEASSRGHDAPPSRPGSALGCGGAAGAVQTVQRDRRGTVLRHGRRRFQPAEPPVAAATPSRVVPHPRRRRRRALLLGLVTARPPVGALRARERRAGRRSGERAQLVAQLGRLARVLEGTPSLAREQLRAAEEREGGCRRGGRAGGSAGERWR